jgi:serine/threonine protein phosphatase PrpC/uncharacterized protein (DUF1499 family)
MALSLDIGACTIGRPGAPPWSNQDAYFTVSNRFAGVFDGVSAAPASRAYAQALASSTRSGLCKNCHGESWKVQAVGALQQATRVADGIDGASTVCLLRFDLTDQRPRVSSFNLGDSGFLLLSPSTGGRMTVTGRSSPLRHTGGAPFQLAGRGRLTDEARAGAVTSHTFAQDQLALCFTDGLSANLPAAEIGELAASCEGMSAAAVATRLAKAAHRRGIVRDDVTVVVGRLRGGALRGGAHPAASRRGALLAIAAASWTGSARAFELGLRDGSLRPCPPLSAMEQGCVSSNPASPPNRYLAPLRFDGLERRQAFQRVRASLAARSDATVIDASADYLHAELRRAPRPDGSGDLADLELRFLPDTPAVTFRLLAQTPSRMPPFCATRGCINGNEAERREIERLRDGNGFSSEDSRFDAQKWEGWVPIFLH